MLLLSLLQLLLLLLLSPLPCPLVRRFQSRGKVEVWLNRNVGGNDPIPGDFKFNDGDLEFRRPRPRDLALRAGDLEFKIGDLPFITGDLVFGAEPNPLKSPAPTGDGDADDVANRDRRKWVDRTEMVCPFLPSRQLSGGILSDRPAGADADESIERPWSDP